MEPQQGYHGESSYDRFRIHIEENLEKGYEAQGSPAKFASKYCLTKYWTVDLVEEIVFATEDFDYQILEIREQYLRIFSTLVWISTTGRSYVRYLKHFVRNGTDDSSLPFRGRPDIFPNANDSEIFWTAFFENQWKFFPVELGPRRMYDRTLHASQILPLTIGEELGAQNIGRPASIHLAHASEMLARTYSTDCNLVLKSYGSLYKSNYYNEIKAYNAFNNATPCENIVRCLGSYHVQPLAPGSGLKFTILLEYANRGSLLEVYQKNDPPFTFAETKAFWSNLLQVAKGLMVAQNTPPKRPGASCVHQDLKPSNILVFSRENVSSSENDLTFKISDFGNSHTRRSAPDDPGRFGYDNGSTRTYCPPELHWNHEVDFTVGPLVDMWSLGCVLIEAAVWICFGQRGRIEFQQRRRSENEENAPTQQGLGRSDSFHNGHTRLKTVEDVLDLVQRHGRRSDELTPKIVSLVLEHLLVNEDRRYDARVLSSELDNIIRTTTERPGHHLFRSISAASSASQSHISQNIRHSQHGSPGDPQMTFAGPQYGTQTPSTTINLMNQNHGSFKERAPAMSTIPGGDFSVRSQSNHAGPWDHYVVSQSSPSRALGESSTTLAESNAMDSIRSAANSVNSLSYEIHGRTQMGAIGQGHSQLHIAHARSSGSPGPAARAATTLTNSSNSTVTPTQPSDHKRTTFPHLAIEDVDARRTEGKAPKSRRLLPGEYEAMKFLKKRDHILMIDNSKHMREFKVQVLDVFANLAHILESADPNGLDVICTSDPGNMQHNKATERLVQFVQNNYDKGASSPCYIEPALKILVDKIISKLPSGPGEKKGLRSWIKNETARPISIYVLTSGVWDSSPGAREGTCGADRPINQLITELKRRNLHKNQVAFQFIRFGDYATGIDRLKFLDNSLGKPDHDIVDHKPSNGGVWPMLVGSLDEGNDREDDT